MTSDPKGLERCVIHEFCKMDIGNELDWLFGPLEAPWGMCARNGKNLVLLLFGRSV